jgi:hypothetical protein
MKHCYFTACLATILSIGSLAAHAQAGFQPGYLVRLTGDTVRGQIKYRNVRQGAQQCLFRAAGEQAATAWLPGQLKGYGLESGERFASQLTPIAPPPAPAGSAVPAPGAPARQLFLEVLAEGAASLLTYKDEAGQEHFYVLKAGAAQPTELVQVRRRVQDGSGSREQVVPVYRGVLTEQFADCPAVLLGVSKTEFKTAALIAAVTSYNVCREPGRVALVSPKRSVTSLEILLGGQASRTTYTTPVTSVTVPAGLSPEVGVGISLGRRVLRQRFTFRGEVHYVRQVAESSESQARYQSVPNQVITQTYDLRFVTAYLRAPLLVRYAVPGTKVRPFVEAGVSFNYALTLDAQLRMTGTSSGKWEPLIPDQMGSDTAYRNYEFGLLAGLGVQFPGLLGGHSLAVLGRAEQSNGFLLINGYNTSVLRKNILVSFNLTKN